MTYLLVLAVGGSLFFLALYFGAARELRRRYPEPSRSHPLVTDPYRTNAAPVAPDLWDGTVNANLKFVGSPTRLVIASNGKVYNRDTREEVPMTPLRNLNKKLR